uniref:Uncharacterized protein n=1 Tax=Anguilla anguilla TaxID=7936 RepID=A0A0E9VRY7_ANGAN
MNHRVPKRRPADLTQIIILYRLRTQGVSDAELDAYS